MAPDRAGRAAALLLASWLCSSCGYVGEPLPPALHIASPVRDLHVVEYGDLVMIDFTIPPLTTEGVVMKRVGEVDLRIGPGANPFDTGRWAEGAKRYHVAAQDTGPVHAEVPVSEWQGKEVVIGTRVINTRGRASEWSNLVSVRIVPPVPTPRTLTAQSDPQGVRLTWQSTESSFRILRKVASDKQPSVLASVQSSPFVDTSAQYGTEYEYRIQALNGPAESPVSAPAVIQPRDEFPPAVPAGIIVAAGAGSIELVWERNTEADIRGYRVYRAVEGGKFERITEFTDAPAYSDRQIESGKKYRYTVSAIDLSGNESAQSAPVEISAP